MSKVFQFFGIAVDRELRDSVFVACHLLRTDQPVAFDREAPLGVKPGGREAPGSELFLLRIPHHDRLATVLAVVYRMQHPNRPAVHRPLPVGNVKHRLLRSTVGKFPAKGFADEWLEELQFRNHLSCFGIWLCPRFLSETR